MSPSRAAVLDAVGSADGTTLAAVAAATGLHTNTVREHLDALLGQGLVSRERSRTGGRGRPAWRYQLTQGPSPDAVGEYAGLAAALAEHLHRTSDDPRAEAVEAGAAWGRRLAHQHPLEGRPAPATARRGVLTVLAELGFAPETDRHARRAVLTRCPLLDTATQYPDVVCGVHLGIVRGALEAYDGAAEHTELHPFSEPHGCLLRLATS